MAQITRLGPWGVSARLYGSFAGKVEEAVVAILGYVQMADLAFTVSAMGSEAFTVSTMDVEGFTKTGMGGETFEDFDA